MQKLSATAILKQIMPKSAKLRN